MACLSYIKFNFSERSCVCVRMSVSLLSVYECAHIQRSMERLGNAEYCMEATIRGNVCYVRRQAKSAGSEEMDCMERWQRESANDCSDEEEVCISEHETKVCKRNAITNFNRISRTAFVAAAAAPAVYDTE